MKRLIFALLLLSGCSADIEEGSSVEESADNTGKLWVTVDRLNRRTCPSEDCGIVGQLMFREGVKVLEEKDGWVRISDAYDASCEGGQSAYVDKGNSNCIPTNGIKEGKFSEWVAASSLSDQRPVDPANSASANESIVAQSDDFGRHRKEFLAAANQLISDGTCTASEIKEMGGWVKSMNNRNQPVYFTYCGGFTTANRIYLNVETGQTYR